MNNLWSRKNYQHVCNLNVYSISLTKTDGNDFESEIIHFRCRPTYLVCSAAEQIDQLIKDISLYKKLNTRLHIQIGNVIYISLYISYSFSQYCRQCETC